ncbi:MAG: hypothetical protein ACLVCH_11705 [Roseburia inulinivorans]
MNWMDTLLRTSSDELSDVMRWMSSTFKESVAKQTGMDQAMLDNMSIEQIGESMGVPT